MYCNNCGKEIDEKAAICVHCGVATANLKKENDNGGFGWGLLGFCVPIVGLVLFLVWKQNKPKTSKSAGIGALISTILIVLFYIIIFVLAAGLA